MAINGSPVHGKVTLAKPSGRLHAPDQLSIRLTSVEQTARPVSVTTTSYPVQGKSHTKSNATKIGGAAAGAIIGALAVGAEAPPAVRLPEQAQERAEPRLPANRKPRSRQKKS